MPRIAFFDKQEPAEVKTKEGSVFICQCGLSKKFPFCDASHKKTEKEEMTKVYQYIDGKPFVIGELHAHDHGSCGCGCECEDEACDCEHEDKKK